MMMRDWGYDVRTKMQGSRFQVNSPYNRAFYEVAISLAGKWRKRSRIWSFERKHYNTVALALNRIYRTTLPTRPDGKIPKESE